MAGSAESSVSGQRRAYERMTAEQFVWWLRGFLSASWAENAPLPKADVKIIQEALDRTGPLPTQPPAVPPSVFEQKCPRCGTPVSLGSGLHLCNGKFGLAQ